MTSKLQQVIRLLLILSRRNEKTIRTLRKGKLLILQSSQHRPLTYTVAAAGPWCQRLVKKVQKEATETVSAFVSICDCPYPEELTKFSDDCGPMRFVHSFQVDQDSQEYEIERFLYRFSLIHGQITIIFKVRKQEHWHQQVFSVKRTYTAVGHTIIMDSPTFGLSLFSVRGNPACNRMHPVLGESFPLFLPSEAVEAGLCGEVKMTSLAMIGPCMTQYPNWPTVISHICVLVYSPSGVPVMQGKHQPQLSFLQSLADSLPWGELGLSQVHCVEKHNAHDLLCPEMVFSAEEIEPTCSHAVSQKVEQSRTVEQTLFLFIFIQSSDPFNSQLPDLIANEEILTQYLDKVLWFNREKVRSGIQSTLQNTLKEFLKRQKSSEKLQSGMSVILSSVNNVVSCSSNLEFRSACLNYMKVQSTHDLSVSLHQTFEGVIRGRFVPSRKCTTEEALEASVSVQAGSSSREEGDHSGLHGKRGHGNNQHSPLMSKRKCTGAVAEDLDSSESSEWDISQTYILPPSSCEQQPEKQPVEIGFEASSTSSDLHNKEVEREWLQEIEYLSEWD